MRKVNLGFAKDHLESLVNEAIAGEEIVIAGKGPVLVRLTPVAEPADAEHKVDPATRRSTVAALCSQLHALPDLDTRDADEILGYDERGLF
jgi:antitoxin (DNA-binding transcriptional repressor) of toxin-antitoxin stability system